MIKIGIIGGSGLYEIQGLIFKKRKEISTPFGKPSDRYTIGQIGNVEIIFLPRHGRSHNLPPHMINYRANIWGFKKLGVKRIISVNAVGGIKKSLRPGDIVVSSQIIDMTKNRKSTFYDGSSSVAGLRGAVVHIDFTEPYCPEMRRILLKAGSIAKIPLINGGTYIAVEGPRLETASEITAFSRIGADIVGMTGMPEASLAREAEICYSGISVVANFAAGISRNKLTTAEVMDAMRASTDKIKKVLKETFKLLSENRKCLCKEALKDTII